MTRCSLVAVLQLQARRVDVLSKTRAMLYLGMWCRRIEFVDDLDRATVVDVLDVLVSWHVNVG
jgi:hypothetical protein